VNISAVATRSLTSIPVSFFHFGPEKWVGSSDEARPSQTIVIERPLYCCAALTAESAADAAHAGLLSCGEACGRLIFPKSRLLTMSPPFFLNGRSYSNVLARCGEDSQLANWHGTLQFASEIRLFEYCAIDDAGWGSPVLNVEHSPDIGCPVSGEAVIVQQSA